MDKTEEKVDRIVNSLYAAYGTDSDVLFAITDKAAVKAIVRHVVLITTTNLCPDCTQEFATCHLPEGCELLFGEGIGNDNIVVCDSFIRRS